MGTATTQARCYGFVQEFSADLLKRKCPKLGTVALAYDDDTQHVYCFITFTDSANDEYEAKVTSCGPFYDPEEPVEDTIARLVEYLELNEETVMRRLFRAELLSHIGCPACGERVTFKTVASDGRPVGSCNDAFTVTAKDEA